MLISREREGCFFNSAQALIEILPGASPDKSKREIVFEGRTTVFVWRRVPGTILSEFCLQTGLVLLIADFGVRQKLVGVSWSLGHNGWQAVLEPSEQLRGKGSRLKIKFEPASKHGAVLSYKVGRDGMLYFSSTDFMEKTGEQRSVFSGYIIVNPRNLAVYIDGTKSDQALYCSGRVDNLRIKGDGRVDFDLRGHAERNALQNQPEAEVLPVSLVKKGEGCLSLTLSWLRWKKKITMCFMPSLMATKTAVYKALTEPDKIKSLVEIVSLCKMSGIGSG